MHQAKKKITHGSVKTWEKEKQEKNETMLSMHQRDKETPDCLRGFKQARKPVRFSNEKAKGGCSGNDVSLEQCIDIVAKLCHFSRYSRLMPPSS